MAAEFIDADRNRVLEDSWISCSSHAATEDCRIFEVEDGGVAVAAVIAPQTPARCRMTVALDSGAGDHVVGPDDIPNFNIEPSAGSRAGRGFIAANGNKIANLGQSKVRVMDSEANSAFRSVVQVAEVSRPLYSVSKICDSNPGVEVTFNSRAAQVKDKNGKIVAKFKRQGGLYLADLEFTDQTDSQPGFTRPGVGA